jgi:hypothetical protein
MKHHIFDKNIINLSNDFPKKHNMINKMNSCFKIN